MTAATDSVDPESVRNVSPEDRKRAQVFFERGKTVADTLNYEFAIEMYISGLNWDPENMPAHKALREISLMRKARGGKPMGFMERSRLPKAARDDFKQQMLNAEKQLGHDPGNSDAMAAMLVAAQKGKFFEVVRWMGPELLRANLALPKPEFAKFIVLKDVYKNSREFKAAAEACDFACRLKPMDQNLLHEARELATMETIKRGGYDQNESFTGSLKDRDSQQRLIDDQKDVRNEDLMATNIREADRAFRANPGDAALLKKLVDALKRTESLENENRAIELLDAKFQETKQYSFRDTINNIKLTQLTRTDRTLRDAIKQNPNDAELRRDYNQFSREKNEEELRIFTERSEAYPTLTEAKYELGRRLFMLGRFDDCIFIFQQVRNDPKYRVTASANLGRAFFEAKFYDEAVDTLAEVNGEYPARGDEKSKEMTYWLARAQEAKGDIPPALKNYSQLFQWDARYRDVQARIRELRERLKSGGAPPAV